MLRWLRARFEPQQARDQDQRYWWQLPDDPQLTASPWRQLLVDLTAPSTFSAWHRKVVEARVTKYDRLRPPMTRVLALAVIAAGIAVVGASWWVFLMLVPGVVQVLLELTTHQYLPQSAPDPGLRLITVIRDVFRRTFGLLPLNVTGVIGAIACPLNLLAVALSQPGGELGWVKIAALAGAIFYLNSGLSAMLMDPSNYSEASVMPSWLHVLRPYVPALSFGVVAVIVAISSVQGRWEPTMVPVAYLCAALTLLLGSTIRNHDRMIAAAIAPAREAIEDGREDLGRMMHDQLGPIKAAAEGAAQVKELRVEWASALASLPALLTHFHTRTGIFDSKRMDLDYLAQRILEPYGVWEQVSCNVAWGELADGDHQTAVTMATALLHNVGQELTEPAARNYPKDIVLECFTTGRGRHKFYHLAVRDHLPPITDWCPPGRSMDELRMMLRMDHDGDLTQEVMGDGTKRIVASWVDVTIPDGYGDPFGVTE